MAKLNIQQHFSFSMGNIMLSKNMAQKSIRGEKFLKRVLQGILLLYLLWFIKFWFCGLNGKGHGVNSSIFIFVKCSGSSGGSRI